MRPETKCNDEPLGASWNLIDMEIDSLIRAKMCQVQFVSS